MVGMSLPGVAVLTSSALGHTDCVGCGGSILDVRDCVGSLLFEFLFVTLN